MTGLPSTAWPGRPPIREYLGMIPPAQSHIPWAHWREVAARLVRVDVILIRQRSRRYCGVGTLGTGNDTLGSVDTGAGVGDALAGVIIRLVISLGNYPSVAGSRPSGGQLDGIGSAASRTPMTQDSDATSASDVSSSEERR